MVTIKEIAELANVSVSTVSKIINKKDGNISEETRERVLQIVREKNFMPYANVKSLKVGSSWLIGVLTSDYPGSESLLGGIIRTARLMNYSTIVCSSFSQEEEKRNLDVLCAHRVDGIIWNRSQFSGDGFEKLLQDTGIPYHIIDPNNVDEDANAYFSYRKIGYAAAMALIQNRHERIGCLLSARTSLQMEFAYGFREAMFSNGLSCDDNTVMILSPDTPDVDLWLHRMTAVACCSEELAGQLYDMAQRYNLNIPADFSVVSVSNSDKSDFFDRISTLGLPFDAFGGFCVRLLAGKIEGTESAALPKFEYTYQLNHMGSIGIPATLRQKSIVVMGTINMDTLLSVARMPQTGETVNVGTKITIPGGKGLNQALGASRLGAYTHLIGKLGKDYDGGSIYEFLKANGVDLAGVSTDRDASTGNAYIYIQNDAESSISVYDGANGRLQTSDIAKCEHLFKNASFCLLQTELRQELVAYAAALAHKYNVKNILKPCAVTSLEPSLLEHIDIMVPNQKEIDQLLPGSASYEAKAQYFLERGVKMVIITLGADGCYLRDDSHSEYFEAAPLVAVDTTGAADAFVATLAVYLSKDYDIRRAIHYATYAAGLSTTRWGVPPGLVDQNMLEMFVRESLK